MSVGEEGASEGAVDSEWLARVAIVSQGCLQCKVQKQAATGSLAQTLHPSPTSSPTSLIDAPKCDTPPSPALLGADLRFMPNAFTEM